MADTSEPTPDVLGELQARMEVEYGLGLEYLQLAIDEIVRLRAEIDELRRSMPS